MTVNLCRGDPAPVCQGLRGFAECGIPVLKLGSPGKSGTSGHSNLIRTADDTSWPERRRFGEQGGR